MSAPAVPAASLAHDRVDLAPERDAQAWRDWAAHVAAGRIGAPRAAPPAGEARLASLAAILAPAPRRGGRA